MAERGIPFSAPMVRALLDGSKTQTRRLCKAFVAEDGEELRDADGWPMRYDDGSGTEIRAGSPFGRPGDRLWVREAWRAPSCVNDLLPSELPVGYSISYTADGGEQFNGRYRHARFMPRWASRITLDITGVRVERLQEISEADAHSEGCPAVRIVSAAESSNGPFFGQTATAGGGAISGRDLYRSLWESLNGPDSWDANPWVWVVAFRRV